MKTQPQDSIEYLTHLTGKPLSDPDKQKLISLDKQLLEAIRELTSSDSIENFKQALSAAVMEYVTSEAFKKMGKENQKEELFNLNCLRGLLEEIGVAEVEMNGIVKARHQGI